MPDPSGGSEPLGSEATRAVVSYLQQNRESPGGALHTYVADRLGRTPEGADLVDGLTREPENSALQGLVSRAVARAAEQDGEFAGGLRYAVDRVHAERPTPAVPAARSAAEGASGTPAAGDSKASAHAPEAGSAAGAEFQRTHVAARGPAWAKALAGFVQTGWFKIGVGALLGLVFLLAIIFGR